MPTSRGKVYGLSGLTLIHGEKVGGEGEEGREIE